MPDNLQDLQDALMVANQPKGQSKKTFSLDLGMQSKPEKPSFYSFSNDTIDMKYDTLSSGEKIARYESYLPGADNNERLAQNQSTGEKWANGVTKALAKTASAVVGGTAGVVNGVGAMFSDGNVSSLYDNNFSNWLADLDTKLGYQLPNYYTKQEQEKGLFGQMGTANFWADKFLGGLSFTAGAIVSEGIWAAATGGASLATTGARLGARAGRALRWSSEALGSEAAVLKGIKGFKDLFKPILGASYRTGAQATRAAILGGKTGELLNLGRFALTSAGYESSVEALQYKREAEENFYSTFESLNGRAPDSEDIANFEKDLESSANAVFGANMAIVGSSNLITMGNIFGLKSPIKTGITDFIEKKAFGRGLTEVVDDAGKVTYNVMTRTGKQKAADIFVNYLAKPMVTEGLFEEGLQGVTTKTANKWIEYGYDPKKTNESLDTMGLMYESMAEQYGTKEGWVENGLGMLIGIVGGGLNARSGENQKKSELEYKASVANAFDKQFLQANLLSNKVKGFNRSKAFFEEATNEAKKGNIVKSELAQKDGIISFVHAKTELGESTKDIVEEAKTAMESVTAEQWNEAGIEDIEAHKEDTLSELGRLSKSYKTNKKYWEYMIGKKIVGENSLQTSALDEVANKNLLNNKLIIESLTWASVRGENANKYMAELQGELAKQVSSESARSISVVQGLQKQSKSVQRKHTNLTNQHTTLTAKQQKLIKIIERVNATPREIETNKGVKNRDLANANQALSAVNGKLNSVRLQIDDIATNMNATKEAQQYLNADFDQSLSGDIITGEDLINLDENIKKFQGSLDFIENADPVRGQYVKDLMDELSQATDIFMLHQATTKMAASAKIENINSWIGAQLKKNKVMDANTNEWLSEVATQYRNRKVELLAEKSEIVQQEGTPQEIEEVEKDLKNAEKGRVIPKSNEQIIKELEQERDEKIDKLKEGLQEEAPVATNTTQPATNWLDNIINIAKENYAKWVRGEYKREPSATSLQLFDNVLTNPTPSGFNNILQQFYNGIRLASYDNSNVELDLEDYTSEVNSLIEEVRAKNGWHYRIPFGASTGKSQYRISLNVKGSKELIDVLDKLSKDYGIYYKTPASGTEWLDRHDPVTIYITDTNLTEAQIQELKDRVVTETRPYIRSNEGFGLYGENVSEGVEFGEEATESNASELIKEAEAIDTVLADGVKQFLTSRDGKIKGSVGQQMAVRQLLDTISTSQPTTTNQSDIEALKKIKRLDLKEDYFTLDFKTFSFFTDENGDIYTKEVGDIDVAKSQSKSARNIISAPDIATFKGKTKEEVVDSLKNSWVKQESNYFEQEDKQSPEEFEKTKEQIKELEQEKETILPEQNETVTNIQAENEKVNKKIEAVNKEYDEKIKQLQGEDRRNKVEIYKQRIKDLLKEDYYNIEYLGEDLDELLKARPSEEDIDRYRELKKQNSQTNEMKALKRRLKNWKLLDAAIGEDYNSIADMIDIINQHEEANKTESKVKTEITEEDLESMLDAKSELNDETLLQNESGSVTAKMMKNGNISFSHLKLETLYERIGGEITIGGKKATKADLDSLYTFGEDIPITIGGINLTMKQSGKIEMDARLFIANQDSLNLYMLNPNSTNWTYKNIFEFMAGETRKVKSGFETNIKSNDVYNTKVGDRVDFRLDMENPFNQSFLLDKFNSGNITRETLTAQVRVVAVKNGKKLSVIKAQREGITDSNFAALRLKAAENLINNLGEDLGISTVVKQVYIGTPELQIDGNGNVVQIPITKEAASKVVIATGYIENGNIVKSNEFPNGEINESYIGKLSRKNKDTKIPFVVVKRGVHNIAYPVSFVKTADSRLKELQDVFSSSKSAQEKAAIEINDLIIKYKLGNDNLIVTEDLENKNTLDNLQNLFDSKENYVDIENFAKKEYDRSNLTTDVTIDINLNNIEEAISDPKLRVSFEKGDVVFKDDFKEMGELPTDNQIEVDPKEERQGKINTDNC